MTDKEIIKAKELIKMLQEAYIAYYDTSKGVPYNIDEILRESAFCLENALKEINRQQETIETLRGCIERHHIIRKDGKSPLSLLTAEIRAEAEQKLMEVRGE